MSKLLTQYDKLKRKESQISSQLYALARTKESKEFELQQFCKRHRSVNFDGLVCSDVQKLERIYSYFDKNKKYHHEWEGGLRCDDRGMILHYWLDNDPDFLVIHISSNHNNLFLSGSTSWIIKAPTLEDKVNVIKTVKKDISKIIQG